MFREALWCSVKVMVVCGAVVMSCCDVQVSFCLVKYGNSFGEVTWSLVR